ATAGESTWEARFAPNTLWTAPGAKSGSDYVATSSASTFVTGLGRYSFGPSAQLLSDVQSWIANPGQNFGWILISDSEQVQKTARRFASREAITNMPALTITFTVPGNTPPSIAQQPQSQTVAQGTRATFTVSAVGSAPLSYQWTL